MKKTRSKIIIKTRKGGYTKIYANGKWQKGVYNLDFHSYVSRKGINISCEFDKYNIGKKGYIVCDRGNGEIVKEHHIARI